jgi:hypothetical protein
VRAFGQSRADGHGQTSANSRIELKFDRGSLAPTDIRPFDVFANGDQKLGVASPTDRTRTSNPPVNRLAQALFLDGSSSV